jgi:hypothetical protein
MNLRCSLTLVFVWIGISISANSYSQTLYLPGGSTDIGNANNDNVGIGTNSLPAEKLHVAGNIQIGSASTSTAGVYHINMPDGSGTINGGNGRDLVITAGSSDNQAHAIGGRLYLRPGNPTLPSNNYGHVIISDNGGNVGIGTPSPLWKLDVNGAVAVRGQAVIGVEPNEINIGDISMSDGFKDKLHFYTHDIRRMTIDENGNVGIGTLVSDAKLTVKGNIHTQEVLVDLSGAIAPDYVFEKDYDLLSLSELEAYINQNKHLPEVPSAKEMEENGLNLKEMNLLLLKKVEELTLHLIEQQKEINKLKRKK